MTTEFTNCVNELSNFVFTEIIPILKQNGINVGEVSEMAKVTLKLALSCNSTCKVLAKTIVQNAEPHMDLLLSRNLEGIKNIKFDESIESNVKINEIFKIVCVAIDNKDIFEDEAEEYIFSSILYIIECAKAL